MTYINMSCCHHYQHFEHCTCIITYNQLDLCVCVSVSFHHICPPFEGISQMWLLTVVAVLFDILDAL